MEIQTKLDEFFREDPQTGRAILIVFNDEIVYQRCFGLAHVQRDEPIHSQTNFRLASLTKQFTAYGIFLLEKENRVQRTDAIGKSFPRSFTEKYPHLSEQVTIEHLLNHRSGIFDFEETSFTEKAQWTDEDVLHSLVDQTYFPPGEQFRYSNTGYILLGLIIENVSRGHSSIFSAEFSPSQLNETCMSKIVTLRCDHIIVDESFGESLDEFFQKRIFSPLNMSNSVLYRGEDTPMNHRAYGTRHGDIFDQSATSGTRGDGGLYMSLEDYLRWYRHIDWKEMNIALTDRSEGFYYHYGWFLPDRTGQTRLHVGNSAGFTHQVYQIDETDRQVLVLYLSNNDENQCDIEKFNRFLLENLPRFVPRTSSLLFQMSNFTR